MALSINQLVNDYGTYSGTTLIGEYGARASVPNRGFGDVKGVPYDNITFVINLNGTKYASSKWIAQQQNGNPYLSSNTVARLDAYEVSSPPKNYLDLDGDGEAYAEMNSTSNLVDDDSILSFINDLVGPDDAVKPASAYGSWVPELRTVAIPQIIQDPLGNPYEIGVIGKKFGNTYSAELDLGGGYPGLQFDEKGFDGLISGVDALSQDTSVEPEEVEETTTDGGSGLDITDGIEINPDIFDDIVISPLDFSDIDIGPINIGGGSGNFGFSDSIDFGFGNFNNGIEFGSNGNNFDTLRVSDYGDRLS